MSNTLSVRIYDQNISEIRNDIKLFAVTMKTGFKSVDKRFKNITSRRNLLD